MISVILPVFNSIKYIERCLESILSQTYTDIELIIIDDGSSDGTSLICDKYAAKDSRIKVIHQNNKGVSEARNLGLKLSQGEYISFIDNDDWISPDYLQSLYESINRGDYSLSMVLYKKTEHYYLSPLLKEYFIKEISGLEIRQKLFEIENYDEPYGFIWAKLYKREILQDLKFKNTIGEDIEFSFQVSYKIKKAIIVQKYMYFWYQHNSSQFRNVKPERFFSAVKCYYQILHEIPKNEITTRGNCLIRLYKTILSVNYNAENYKQIFKDINYNNRKIVKETQKEFVINKSIPFQFKFFLLLFYYQPYLYKIFRKIIPLLKK